MALYHPECAEDEIFVGNTDEVTKIQDYLNSIPSIRLGNIAYDICGGKLPVNQYRPVIMKKVHGAMYDKIMMDRFKKMCEN
jgi:hypothetical protein